MPRPLQGPGRAHQARRAASWRLPARAARHVALRALRQADHHALSQLPRHGVRGAAAQPSDRRGGADGRLRQDHARTADGGDLHGPAGDLLPGRPHAARQLEGRAARQRLGHLEVLGRAARRNHHRGRLGRGRSGYRAVQRPLHDHGHGEHHDLDRRNPRFHLERRGLDSGPRCQSRAFGVGLRAARRRDGLGRPQAERPAVTGLLRERHRCGDGDGLLDQRHRAPGGARPARRLR